MERDGASVGGRGRRGEGLGVVGSEGGQVGSKEGSSGSKPLQSVTGRPGTARPPASGDPKASLPAACLHMSRPANLPPYLPPSPSPAPACPESTFPLAACPQTFPPSCIISIATYSCILIALRFLVVSVFSLKFLVSSCFLSSGLLIFVPFLYLALLVTFLLPHFTSSFPFFFLIFRHHILHFLLPLFSFSSLSFVFTLQHHALALLISRLSRGTVWKVTLHHVFLNRSYMFL